MTRIKVRERREEDPSERIDNRIESLSVGEIEDEDDN